MTGGQELLFLAHRLPYPPNKGDKIRSWNILSRLRTRYTVHLGCFVDNPRDWESVGHLKDLCAECHFAELKPTTAKMRSLSGLLTGKPLTLPYYRDAGLASWVSRVMEQRDLSGCYAFSSSMAQYVEDGRFRSLKRIIDLVDVDSEKWRQFAQKKSWPSRAIYRREGEKLLKYERAIAADFDRSLFVSTAEAELFGRLAPEVQNKISCVPNGVDFDYFSPDCAYESPYSSEGPHLVLTGAMDYWPNADAAVWFAQDILPLIRRAIPDAVFCVVGADPAPSVRRLADLPSVWVTGQVPDIRPYLAHAAVAVAPLLVARGIQNKVLEAMAMAVPVVATPAALEGLGLGTESSVSTAQEPSDFADQILSLLTSSHRGEIGQQARAKILSDFSWDSSLAGLFEIFEGKSAAAIQHV